MSVCGYAHMCVDVHGGQSHHTSVELESQATMNCLKCLLSPLTEWSLSIQLYWLASVPPRSAWLQTVPV